MEIILIVVGVVVLLFVIGGIDNNRPVTSWSDEKLTRMHDKLIHAARTAQAAGNMEQAKSSLDKANEVKLEVQRRTKDKEMNSKIDEAVQIANDPEMNSILADIGIKMGYIYHAAQKKYDIPESEAYEVIDQELIDVEKKYQQQGYDEDSSTIKAVEEIYGKYQDFI